ncbi:MAG: hypothetical protein KatS3mg011_0691 [Acidimicrobiia bacterium]|nr:MAG: hypothetical protein KatS3mg011_0691 [Acidimicrobiia bacterium]
MVRRHLPERPRRPVAGGSDTQLSRSWGASHGDAAVLDAPNRQDFEIETIEILLDRPDCLVIYSTTYARFSDAGSSGVDVLWPDERRTLAIRKQVAIQERLMAQRLRSNAAALYTVISCSWAHLIQTQRRDVGLLVGNDQLMHTEKVSRHPVSDRRIGGDRLRRRRVSSCSAPADGRLRRQRELLVLDLGGVAVEDPGLRRPGESRPRLLPRPERTAGDRGSGTGLHLRAGTCRGSVGGGIQPPRHLSASSTRSQDRPAARAGSHRDGDVRLRHRSTTMVGQPRHLRSPGAPSRWRPGWRRWRSTGVTEPRWWSRWSCFPT